MQRGSDLKMTAPGTSKLCEFEVNKSTFQAVKATYSFKYESQTKEESLHLWKCAEETAYMIFQMFCPLALAMEEATGWTR